MIKLKMIYIYRKKGIRAFKYINRCKYTRSISSDTSVAK